MRFKESLGLGISETVYSPVFIRGISWELGYKRTHIYKTTS